MPRLKLKRFKADPPAPAVFARYGREYHSRTLHFAPESLPPITSDGLFGNDAPLYLDLGCGRGEFVRHLATIYPNANIVGIDRHWKSIWDAINKSHADRLENVLFIRGDVRKVVRRIPDEAVHTAFLLFPPPRLEQTRIKDDLLNAAQIAMYQRLLCTGGHFHFVTDNDDYFARRVDDMVASGRFALLLQQAAFEGGNTAFQKRWEQWGIQSKRAALLRL